MITVLFICLVVTATIQDNEARSQENHIPYKIIVENAKSRKNKEEIAKIIKYLNNYSKTEFEQNGDNTIEDADGLKLTDLMELAQKNYDTRVANDNLVAASISSRVHVIKNPEVLKDYIEALRKGHSTSDSDDSSSDYDRIDNEYADIRRKAEPRYRNDDSNEKYGRKDITNIDVEVEKKHSASLSNDQGKSNENEKAFVSKRSRNGNKNKPEDDDDVWGMITKNSENDGPISKESNRYNEKNKQRHQQTHDSDYRVTRKKEFGGVQFNNKGFDNKKRESERNKKRKNSWDDDKNWKQNTKNDYTRSEDKIWKETTIKHNSWNEDKGKIKYDSMETGLKKITVNSEWNDFPKKNKRIESQERNRDYKPKKIENNWHDWSDNIPVKTTRYQEKPAIKPWERKQSYDKPSYVPRIPEYHNVGRIGGSGFLGRTPIPFVGKKGIYEDN